jgi:hypothetical protein
MKLPSTQLAIQKEEGQKSLVRMDEFNEATAEKRLVYTQLTPDLRERMVKAANLDLSDSRSSRQSYAVKLLATLGEDPNRLRAATNNNLERFLQGGRALGLSEPISQVPALPGPSAPQQAQVLVSADFATKYNLRSYEDFSSRSHLETGFSNKVDYDYTRDLPTIYEMALTVKDTDHAKEALTQMLRIGGLTLGVAIDKANAAGAGETAVRLSLMALSRYFSKTDASAGHNAYISMAIYGLGKVRGPAEYQAKEILYDLAMELKRAGVASSSNVGNILLALRLTGTVVGEYNEDGYRTPQVHIEDPKVIRSTTQLIDELSQNQEYLESNSKQIRITLFFLNDKVRLNRIGKHFEKLSTNVGAWPGSLGTAFDFYKSADNKDDTKRLAYHIMNRPVAGWDEMLDLQYKVLPALTWIYDTAGLVKLDAVAQTGPEINDIKKRIHDSVAETVFGIFPQNEEWNRMNEANTETHEKIQSSNMNPVAKSPLYMQIVAEREMQYIAKKFDSTKRAELIAKGYQAMKEAQRPPPGSHWRTYPIWDAYVAFKNALSRKGLMDLGDLYTEFGYADCALDCYLRAALLPQESVYLPAH